MLNEYNTSRPLPSDYFRDIYSNLRMAKLLFKERFILDHHFSNNIDTSLQTADGFHNVISMPEYSYINALNQTIYEPDSMADSCILFCKKINGIVELCVRKNDGVYQITENGQLSFFKDFTYAHYTSLYPNYPYICGAFINGNYYIISEYGRFHKSSDMKTWTTNVYWNEYHTPTSLRCVNGMIAVTTYQGYIYLSPDGITWPYSSKAGVGFQSITYGNGKYVAVGSYINNKNISISSNGAAWTTISSGISEEFKSVTFGNGLFVAVSSSGNISTSADGITWTSRTANKTPLLSVAFGNNIFIAVGNSGLIMRSVDGLTWTVINIGITFIILGVDYLRNTFVAFGRYSDNHYFISSDGLTWIMKTRAANNYSSIKNIFYADCAMYEVSGDGSGSYINKSTFKKIG
ncbi:MAG: hypothetical protein CVV49_00600 [Spirochaetae bacterium HGW-Spirochaetae-5]|nr:MAG: hypothetical protein CVV49_00600 [Spirochaetae bacterium HGW-Spirochaetae-5]